MAKYKISKRIGRGGMAEVFLAVQEGLGGFEKLVVVKRIYPQFCDDEHFVNMFLQEARLAASIHHPNVVHINDIDRDESGYILVMEYLAGESLAFIWEALRARRKLMPPNIVCRIGASIAAGLHHAHIATDAAGKEQPIVHRDVTPSNLICCFNGVVKIVDFGVAKATLAEGQTRAGALKGKMSYLSPEQVKDEAIDGRTDIFQLGICLHETLTGRRLFRGKNDHAKISSVMDKEIVPPSQFNPRVPRVLDEIVLKALSRDKETRHQTGEALRRDLEHALAELGNVVTESDVSEWMRTEFKERHAERLALERDCVSQVREGRPTDGSGSGVVVFSEGASRVPPQRTPTMATAIERQGQSTVGTGIGGKTAVWTAMGIAGFVALISIIAWQIGGQDGGSAKTSSGEVVDEPTVATAPEAEPGPVAVPTTEPIIRTKVHISATPRHAEIFIDDQRIGVGYGEREMVVEGAHMLRVSANGFETYEKAFDGPDWPRTIDLVAKSALPTEGPIANGKRKPDSKKNDSDSSVIAAKPDADPPDKEDKKDTKKDDKKDAKKDDFFNKTDNINPFD